MRSTLKTICIATTLGFLAYGNAIAADYTVGIGGIGFNVYSITEKGVKLVQQYIYPGDDYTGNPASPLRFSINPQHDFVYIAYTAPVPYQIDPIIAAYSITPKGLVLQWQSTLLTGDPSLMGTTLVAGRDYVIENTFPVAALWVEIYSNSGQHIVDDKDTGVVGQSLISGHISPNEKFYYSCRGVVTGYTPMPATTVVVYEMVDGGLLDTSVAQPLATSTDPVFAANLCLPTPIRYGAPGNDPGP